MNYCHKVTTHAARCAGIALPSTLIALFLGLFVLKLSQLKASTAVQLRSDLRLVHQLKEDLLRTVSDQDRGETRCKETLGKYHEEQRKWLACRELPSPYQTIPITELSTTHFDFDSLFREATNCPVPIGISSSRRQAIPYASRSCLFRALSINSLTLLENLEGNSLSVKKSARPKFSTIATPGRFAVEQVLETETDLLIVAGGDVSIKMISNLSLQPIRVTIVSARGNIAVAAVGRSVYPLAIGRGRMNVPSTTYLQPYPLPPEATMPRVIGLINNHIN